jgi:hypothetical protein
LATAIDHLADLEARRGEDGGWPFGKGASATEPTALAALALVSRDATESTIRLSLPWFSKVLRSDGGCAPSPAVPQSTYVTALHQLLSRRLTARRAPPLTGTDRSLEWLLSIHGEESSFWHRARAYVRGEKLEDAPDGWPWYSGAAAWVVPTAYSLMALKAARKAAPSSAPALSAMDRRIQSGIAFLHARVCSDGGWNHGAARALGYEANSYPESTGVALVALHGEKSKIVTRALDVAAKMLVATTSTQAQCWLRLGLMAHGRSVPQAPAASPPRDTIELALTILADAAARGSVVLWS